MREWLVLLTALVVLAFLLPGLKLFWRIDQTLYDEALRLTHAPFAEEIVVVAVDEGSLAQLGRWPWRRAVHAALVDRLTDAKPKAVFLDVMFTEVDGDPANDVLLAGAIARNGRVVLPVVLEASDGVRRARGAIQSLREAAAREGHINVALDPDGALRRVPLAAGIGTPQYPHVSRALLEIAGLRSAPAKSTLTTESVTDPIVFADSLVVPFSAARPRIVSFAAVLAGAVPKELLAGKYVLVGMTASGAGDAFVTPISGDTMAAMAGIEIHAHILNAELKGHKVLMLPPWQIGSITAALLALLLAIYLKGAPRIGLASTFALAVLVLVSAFLLMFTARVWIGPVYAIVLIFVAYPLWSWRRLEAAQRYMLEEVKRLSGESDLLPALALPTRVHDNRAIDEVEKRIDQVRQAAERLRNLRRFVSDSLEQLPDAALVADRAGTIVLANDRAAIYLKAESAKDLVGKRLTSVLGTSLVADNTSWTQKLEPALTRGESFEGESETVDGQRALLVRVGPIYSARAQQSGVIAGLTDVSAIHAAEQKRDEVLKVMTHDMRAPQASILTLIEMHRADPAVMPASVVVERAGRYAERTLALADGFLKMAKAEEIDLAKLPEVSLIDAISDAADTLWPQATQRGIKIVRDFQPDDAFVRGDFDLLSRAFANLIGNAVKYSPQGTQVKLSLRQEGDEWIADVADQGYGIPEDKVADLFSRFGRIDQSNPEKQDGAGLGLMMVRSFVEAHHGRISVRSSTVEGARGTTFTIRLPVVLTPE